MRIGTWRSEATGDDAVTTIDPTIESSSLRTLDLVLDAQIGAITRKLWVKQQVVNVA